MKLLVFILLFFALLCNAQEVFSPRTMQTETARQKYNWRHAIAPAALSFVAGAAWGTNQTLEHQNAEFFRVFPNANERFWGVDSWRNKYHNFDPAQGRNAMPIWFTDGNHMTASATQITMFAAGICVGIGEKRKWWHYAADVGISFAAYSLGNILTYNIIFQ
jgi:hypothetical protein